MRWSVVRRRARVARPGARRVKGTRAFEAFVTEMNAWIARRNVSVQDVDHVVTERRGFEEVVLQLDGDTGRVELRRDRRGPRGRRTDRRAADLLQHLAIDQPSANRPQVPQPDPELRESDIVAEYQRALAAGEVDAIVAAFESDGYAREPAGGRYIHTGPDGLRSFY